MLARACVLTQGGAVGIFLGGTTKSYYGLDSCTEENPILCVPLEKIFAEISDKGAWGTLACGAAVVQLAWRVRQS